MTLVEVMGLTIRSVGGGVVLLEGAKGIAKFEEP